MKKFQELYINLNGYDVEAFISQLTKSCDRNWKRATEREQWTKDFNEKAFSFEHIGGNGSPDALLTLIENDKGIWYVPNIIPISADQLNVDEYNKILIDFKCSLVDTVITNTPIHIQLTKNEVFLEDIVGKEVATKLELFSKSANKYIGFSGLYDRRWFENRRWFEFILAAQKSGIELSYDLLKDTLLEQGWSEEWAHDLALEYEYSEKLLDFAKEA